MTSRAMRYLSVALVALAMIATVAGGSADAKKKKSNPAVKSVSCTGTGQSTCTATKTGSAVAITVDTPAAPAPVPGGGGGGVQKFDANLTTGQTKSVTSGNYVLSTTAAAGGVCGNIELANTTALMFALIDDADAQTFTVVAAVGSATLDTVSPMYVQFSAGQTLPLGPAASGQASAVNVVAGSCQTGGYIV